MDTDFEDFNSVIKDFDTMIDSINVKKREYLQKWAENTCPYKVGDKVVSKGKWFAGHDSLITKVSYSRLFRDKYEWCVCAQPINPDDDSLLSQWGEHQDNKD
jgi:hypothetical protein